MIHLRTEEVRSASFFADYEASSNRCDLERFAVLFAESFLAAGRQGSQMVRREDFLAFLPKRHRMLQALGCREARMTAIREMPLGAAHLLATTEWEVEAAEGEPGVERGPIRVTSTFLLEERDGRQQIVLYLPHDDLEGLLRERRADQ